MSNTISFMTANYVARQVGYQMHGWGHGDKATNEYFRPVETYAPRLNEILRDIRALGFDAIDLWLSHLNFTWATDEHVQIARELLTKQHLRVVSLAGWFGANREEFEMSCKLATALGTKILGGSTSFLQKDRGTAIALLQEYDLKLGLENHPEKNPQELLAKIGDGGEGTLGATVDTGWFGTQGYDATRALDELRDVLFHVHLKDVLHAGEPHDTCRYGQGVVPIEACVETLKRIGYAGAISIEHEPEHYDPSEDVRVGAERVKEWMKEG